MGCDLCQISQAQCAGTTCHHVGTECQHAGTKCQHEGTICMHNMYAQHEGTILQHLKKKKKKTLQRFSSSLNVMVG